MLKLFSIAAVAATLTSLVPASHAQTLPAAGCYERAYDAAHLAAHKGQIVRQLRVVISYGAAVTNKPGDPEPIIADANAELWVGKRTDSFSTLGSCWRKGDGLLCNASLSAEERGLCKNKRDGVHSCRIDYGESGQFRVTPAPDGILLTVVERLELSGRRVSEGGDYLYLSPGNAENHAFLLKPADAKACK